MYSTTPSTQALLTWILNLEICVLKVSRGSAVKGGHFGAQSDGSAQTTDPSSLQGVSMNSGASEGLANVSFTSIAATTYEKKFQPQAA